MHTRRASSLGLLCALPAIAAVDPSLATIFGKDLVNPIPPDGQTVNGIPPFVKMATLSSTFSGTTARNCYDASCTDGSDDCAKDTTTEISKLCMTCADTCADDHACAYGKCKYDNPWVQLDLNEPAMLRDFVIFNRPSQDLNGEGAKRLTGALEVYISNESFISPGGARTTGNFKDELLCYSACVHRHRLNSLHGP